MPLRRINLTSRASLSRFALAVACVVLAVAPGAPQASGAGQRSRARSDRTQQQPRSSGQQQDDAAAQSAAQRSGRLTPLRSSETPGGSRVTVTSDARLSDYSAYRSGDRYVVVLPKADARAVSGGVSGRGFKDAQVQQRGDDVVLSFRLEPGASARVNQRFNRLDVEIASPGGGGGNKQSASSSAQTSAGANTAQADPRARQNAATGNTSTATRQENNTEPSDRRAEQANARPTNAATPTASPSAVENLVTNALPQPSAAAPTPAENASTDVNNSGGNAEQVARVTQPPAPASALNNSTAAAAQTGGTSFAAALARNWPLALVAALLLVGFGLFFAARRSSAAERSPRGANRGALKDVPASKSLPAADDAVVTPARPTRTAAVKRVVEPQTAPATEPTKLALDDEATTAQIMPSPAPAVVAVEESAQVSSGQTSDELSEALQHAKSPAERAAAARSLGLAGVAAATPFLLKALADKSLEVRRASVEALAELRDPAAVEPLKALRKREKKQKQRVPSTLMQRAIAACTVAAQTAAAPAPAIEEETKTLETTGDDEATLATEATVAADPAPAAVSDLVDAHTQTEASETSDTIEASVSDVEDNSALASAPPYAVAGLAGAAALVAEQEREAAEDQRRVEATAAAEREAAEDAARREAELRLREEAERAAEAERVAAEARRVEEEKRAAEEARLKAEAEDRRLAEEAKLAAERQRAAEEARQRLEAEEEARRVEQERLRVAEVERRRQEVVARRLAEEAEQKRQAEAEARRQAEEEEAGRQAAEEQRRRAEEETAARRAEQERLRAEAEARAAEESRLAEEKRRAEAEAARAAAEAARLAEDQRQREEAEQQRRLAQEARLAEELRRQAEEERRAAEEARRVEEEKRAAEAARAAEEARSAEQARLRAEAEKARLAEEARIAQEEARAQEERRRAEEEAAAEREAAAAARAAEFETSVVEPQPFVRNADEAAEWVDVDMSESAEVYADVVPSPGTQEPAATALESATPIVEQSAGFAVSGIGPDKALEVYDESLSTVPKAIQERLVSEESGERVKAVELLSRLDSGEAFEQICAAFDDENEEVRASAARALHDYTADRADSFTRALREANTARRRHIGSAIAASGLAEESIGRLSGESRETTYEAFSLLFLMAKAGEVQPLLRAVEHHHDNEVRLAVVKLLALSGQHEVLPAFRRLAVRGSLPTEVRAAVMEAIYQISSGQPDHTHAG